MSEFRREWLLAWEEQARLPRAASQSAGGERALGFGAPDFARRRAADSRDRLAATLELARSEMAMDVAVLGEIRGGREVVRALAGDARSFGLKIGASIAIEESYCDRLLHGRLSNPVRDARADEMVCELELTRTAGIGAYIGVPLTALDAGLYILCCLAHEKRPSLGERDVMFLRGLSETITAALDTRPHNDSRHA